MKTDTISKYMGIIKNKIVYAEDYMIRIMVYDGISVVYYPKTVIWYEYGTGISTSKNDEWDLLLHTDFETSNDLISQREAVNCMQKKFKKYLKLRKNKLLNKLLKILFFPSVFIYRAKFRYAKSYIPLKTNKTSDIEKMCCWIDN